MNRYTKTLALALAGLGAVSSLATDALACGGRGGGFGGGYGGYGGPPSGQMAPRPFCQQPPFGEPHCARQPQFPPMNVQVHNPGAFGNFQPPGEFAHPGGFEQPDDFQGSDPFEQPGAFSQVGGRPTSGGLQQPRNVQPQVGFQQSGGFQQLGGTQQVGSVQKVGAIQQVGGGQVQGGGIQQVGVAQPSGGTGQASSVPSGAIGGGQPIQSQPIQGQQGQGQQGQGQQGRGQQGQGLAIQGQQSSPQQAQPEQGPSQQVPTQQAPNQPVSGGGSAAAPTAPLASQGQPQGANPLANAQQSALDALGGSDEGSAQVSAPVAQPSLPAAQQTQSTVSQSLPAGQFTASPGNGSTIRLSLSENGAFTWTATFKGKTSTFQGTASVSGTAVTLNRSNDNQKLEGSVALTANGFTLKLSGQKDNGLDFVRG